MNNTNGEIKILLVLGLIVLLGGGTLFALGRSSEQAGKQALPPDATPDLFKTLFEGARYTEGPANAPVTVLEFADFQCSHCREAFQVVKKDVLGSPNVRFAFRHLPLPKHERALPAAVAAEAAGRQGKFWPMYALLFDPSIPEEGADQGLTDDYFVRAARKIGLDMGRFDRDLKDPALVQIVQADSAAARENRINSTPSFLVRDAQGKVSLVTGGQRLKDLLRAPGANAAPGAGVPGPPAAG